MNGYSSDFEFTLTRQVQLDGEDECRQIKLILAYDSKDIDNMTDENFWAMDYDNIQDWKTDIEKSTIYNAIKSKEFIRYEVFIDNIK